MQTKAHNHSSGPLFLLHVWSGSRAQPAFGSAVIPLGFGGSKLRPRAFLWPLPLPSPGREGHARSSSHCEGDLTAPHITVLLSGWRYLGEGQGPLPSQALSRQGVRDFPMHRPCRIIVLGSPPWNSPVNLSNHVYNPFIFQVSATCCALSCII